MGAARNESEAHTVTPPTEIDGKPTTPSERASWLTEYVTCGARTHVGRFEYAQTAVQRLRLAFRGCGCKDMRAGKPLPPAPPEAAPAVAAALATACEKWQIDAGEIDDYENARARHWWWAVVVALYKPTRTAELVRAKKSTIETGVGTLRRKHPELAAEAIRYAAELKARMATTNEREEKAA
jgi:hypothetical protein